MNKLLLSLLVCAAWNAHAMTRTCPSSVNYQHVAVGADWQMSNEYMGQGWSISQTAPAQNFGGITPNSNALHVVLNNANDTNTFYMSCKTELISGKNGLTVDAYLSVPQADPSADPNFKRVNNNTYVCETTINHPEACVSNDAAPARIVHDSTGGSVN